MIIKNIEINHLKIIFYFLLFVKPMISDDL